jgi:23S rRNA (cytidine2498-2'-O)-methyltransferase
VTTNPLFYAPNPPDHAVFWQLNTWLSPFKVEFDSIKEAARALRGIQRNWAPVLTTQFRRGELIRGALPYVNDKPHDFPWLLPDAPMGAFTLTDAHTLIASAECTSPFPGGVLRFRENKVEPPSRAYLKLWEALTRARVWPQPGQLCVDAGACPGGWTWALRELGANVLAIDRAELDSSLMSGNIRFVKHDAFTLTPEQVCDMLGGVPAWVCSDVICYPQRLYEWVEKWLAFAEARPDQPINFVCTIKMQGGGTNNENFAAAMDTARRFAAIPGSTVTHLCYNKHELCWVLD